MDAVQFLKKEHQKAKAALGKIVEATADRRGALWEALELELAAHEEIEDTLLYTPFGNEAGAVDPTLAAYRRHHQDEVDEVEELIGEIDELDPEDPHWLAIVRSVRERLVQHIREEEHDILPRIAQAWSAARLERAGTEMHEMMAKVARED